jgi:hypothetical protein
VKQNLSLSQPGEELESLFLQENLFVEETDPLSEHRFQMLASESLLFTSELFQSYAGDLLETWIELEQPAAPDAGGVFTFTAKTLPVSIAVFVSPAAKTSNQVEVLFFVHGLDVCKPIIKSRPATFITEKPFQLGGLVSASGRPIVLVVPFLDWERLLKNKMNVKDTKWHRIADPVNFNAVIDDVLIKMADQYQTAVPEIMRLIVAGHSRAYGVLDALAFYHGKPEMTQGALARLSHVWALGSTYTAPIKYWKAWLQSRDDFHINVIYRHGKYLNKKTQAMTSLATGVKGSLYLELSKQFKDRITVTPLPMKEVGHCAMVVKYLPGLIRSLPAPAAPSGEDEYELEVANMPSEFWYEGAPDETEDHEAQRIVDFNQSETDEEESEMESFAAFADFATDEAADEILDEDWLMGESLEPELDYFEAGEERECLDCDDETESSYEWDELEVEEDDFLGDEQDEIVTFEEESGVLASSGLTSSELKALKITSTFETGQPGGFYGLSGNFDGQGLSFGLVNWTIGTGSLQPLLRDFAAQFPDRWSAVFGPHAAAFLALIKPKDKASQAAQHRFAIDEMNISLTVNGKRVWSIKEPWITYFKRLSEEPAFQRIQVGYVRDLLDRADYFCRYFGLKSERAFAFMFDAVSSHGKWWLTKEFSGGVQKRRTLLRPRLQALETKYGKGLVPEDEKLLAIADVLGETSSSPWSAQVRERKRWFVTGQHRRAQELADLHPRADIAYHSSTASSQPAPSTSDPVASPPTTRPASNPSAASSPSTRNATALSFDLSAYPLSTQKVTLAKYGDKKKNTAVSIEAPPAQFLPQIIRLASEMAARDKKADLAVRLDPARWFQKFTQISFLGRKLRSGQYVHLETAQLLKSIEAEMVKKYGGDAKSVGNILLLASSESIAGSRKVSSTATYSMHMFGLAIDVNYLGNPFIQERAIPTLNSVLSSAAQLLNQAPLAYDKDKLAGLDAVGDRFDRILIMDNMLEKYFGLLDLPTELDRLLQASSSHEWRGSSGSSARDKIQKHLDKLSSLLARGDTSKYKRKNYFKQHAILNFDKRFVVQMEEMGMHWGGQYGDMMHFDMRKTGVGYYINKARLKYAGQVRDLAKKFHSQNAYGAFPAPT